VRFSSIPVDLDYTIVNLFTRCFHPT
jgi:hypothetical protein